MNRFRTTPEAYQLLHEGALALSEVMHNGVRVDKGYLETALKQTKDQIKELEGELRRDPVWKRWQRRFGDRAKLTAPQQLGTVIFKELGYTPKVKAKKRDEDPRSKKGEADESAFEHITDLPFLKTYFKAQKVRKGRGTYLLGIQREMVEHDGLHFVHPSYNLNTTKTFRSSCDNPNWQNVPVRIEWLAEMVRRSYIPRPGHQLVEIDYSQVEIRVAGMYTQDPQLIEDVTRGDVHRDLACRMFFLDPKDVGKAARHLAKNKFVFPEFYGDFYPRCAKNIWEAIGFQKVKAGKNNDGASLHDHLAQHGITTMGACDPDERPVPGTFEYHIKTIEDYFWNERWRVFTQWKKDWYADYQRNCGFMMATGFAVNGPLSRNDVINYPIQGPAFHCNLKAIIKINRALRRHRMRSRVVGQIHDCIVGDVHPRERDDYIHMCRQIMVEEVARDWAWVTVPLEVEAEVCPIDGSWFDKAGCVLNQSDDTWRPADEAKWEKKYGPWSKQVAA